MATPSSMKLKQQQTSQLKLTQHLMMSVQMQQALKLLQLPVLELAAVIDLELEQNPLLEYGIEDDEVIEALEEETEEDCLDEESTEEDEVTFDDRDFEILKKIDEEFRDYFLQDDNTPHSIAEEKKLKALKESSIRDYPTLFESLIQQAREIFPRQDELAIAEILIGYLNQSGYLDVPLHEIALLTKHREEELLSILHNIQTLDPPGIGARTVQESLLIQLKRQGKEKQLSYRILLNHYPDLLHNRLVKISKKLKVSLIDIHKAINQDIASLDFQPGFNHFHDLSHVIVPDVSIKELEGKWTVMINEDSLPPLRCNRHYLMMLTDETIPTETKEYIKQKLNSAKWLMKNLFQRNVNLERLVEALLKYQKSFLTTLDGHIQPLKMKTLAEELEVHESTIARIVANKYIDCPRGTFPLKHFFSHAYFTKQGEDISADAVQEVLIDIIAKENKYHPLSDQALSHMMKERGISCARRTIAKYRALLNIGNTHQRRVWA